MTEKEFIRAMEIVSETAQLILFGRPHEGYIRGIAGLYEFSGDSPEVDAMRCSMIAMLTEEIAAKRHENITEVFNKIRVYIHACKANYLPSPYYEVVLIAVAVLGAEEASDLFDRLVAISADVTEECGVYAGGF